MSDRLFRRVGSSEAPVTPGGQGRFGDFDALAHAGKWDLVTARVVLARLNPDPELRFFSRLEEPTARTLVDLLLGQHEEPRVPVVELIDQRLAAGETDGWRYEDMPEDAEAWRRSLASLDDEATERHNGRFGDLSLEQQAAIVQGVQDSDQWRGWQSAHLWSLWTRYACTAFYSHPWAWNEMGFGGPAYPRGYKNLGLDKREGWETSDNGGRDPVPWARHREEAIRAHTDRVGERGKDGS